MPDHARQVTPPTRAPQSTSSSSTTTSSGSRGSPGWAAGQQGRMGNEALAGMISGSVEDKVPGQLDLQEAGLSFQLPGGVALTEGWHPLTTTGPTGVWFTVSRQALRVQFSPPLLVDAQWPLSNVAWSGFTYDFAAGRVSHVGVENTQIAIPIAGKVESEVRAFVGKIVAGTRLARGGYDPLADADLGATLKALKSNVVSQGSPSDKDGRGGLDPKQVKDVGFSATFKMKQQIEAGSADGAIALPAGASLSLNVAVAGNGASLPSATTPEVQTIHLSSSDLVLSQKGKPVARIRSLRVDRGGAVDVTDFEPLGKLAEIGAGESLVRLLGVMAALRGGDPRLAGSGDISPRVVNGVAEKEIERSLTAAVRDLVRQHHDAVPGVDLLSVLGVSPKKDGKTS